MRRETLQRRKKVLSLCLRGYTPSEVAEALGVSRQTVYNDIFRMREGEEWKKFFVLELRDLISLRSAQRMKELWKLALSAESEWVRAYTLKQLRLEDMLLLQMEKFYRQFGDIDMGEVERLQEMMDELMKTV